LDVLARSAKVHDDKDIDKKKAAYRRVITISKTKRRAGAAVLLMEFNAMGVVRVFRPVMSGERPLYDSISHGTGATVI